MAGFCEEDPPRVFCFTTLPAVNERLEYRSYGKYITSVFHTKKTIFLMRILLLAVFLVFFIQPITAQTFGTASHTVRVTVATITTLQVTSGTVNLAITGADAVAGQDQMTTTDQSTSLLWGVNSSAKKITVQSSLAAPLFTLKLLAVAPTQGTAAPEVTLSSVPQNLLLDIGRSSGTCVLKYTGIALASQGTGNDPHTITFTIANQ